MEWKNFKGVGNEYIKKKSNLHRLCEQIIKKQGNFWNCKHFYIFFQITVLIISQFHKKKHPRNAKTPTHQPFQRFFLMKFLKLTRFYHRKGFGNHQFCQRAFQHQLWKPTGILGKNRQCDKLACQNNFLSRRSAKIQTFVTPGFFLRKIDFYLIFSKYKSSKNH